MTIFSGWAFSSAANQAMNSLSLDDYILIQFFQF